METWKHDKPLRFSFALLERSVSHVHLITYISFGNIEHLVT